ncbi:DUF2332 domain-containing protein [Nocardioides sp. TF02-7]|uniref:DUF2332 domain-containing protein n=1 Tax=Nocardioides sp. TF02-7 TaxID=2917724 RepID=UPI001F06AB10|nr:DUF2332 domain-containing protein [Nocardioides sp. TF02-7]UMG94308.1 DUF2332 domain-containing protein [Nocardioides sp. TF02-7]
MRGPRGVVDDPEVQAWLETLPDAKQQPNLVFAAARWHGLAAPAPYEALRSVLLGDDGAVRGTILTRATQTNEAGRLATLTPVFALAAAGRPVALLEVGASAGLCLYPDRWRYRWHTAEGVRAAGPPDGVGPVLECAVTGPVPLPEELPTVVWRGGIDLNPLDVTAEDDRRWLLTLVWPEHDDRREQLARAIDVARSDPPDVRRGDLFELLPARLEEARAAVGSDGVVVVFHSAVVAYLEEADRARFDRTMRGAGRGRPLPLGEQRGPPRPPHRDGDRPGAAGRAVRARARRSLRRAHPRARPVPHLVVTPTTGP